MNIKVYNKNEKNTFEELKYESFVFSGGEVSVKFKPNYRVMPQSEFKIVARLQNTQDLFSLALIKDAIIKNFKDVGVINLVMPYIPYARQDRVCAGGESFSLKVFCDYINSLSFNKVKVYDPHSDVAPALINNVEVYDQIEFFQNRDELAQIVFQNQVVFVSPDAGANKKTTKLAGYFGRQIFIRADKLRNLETGDILETVVYADDLQGQNVMIVDDIADGGATFKFLAKELKKLGAGKVILFVTHGIFSKGFEHLLEDIDEIITTNSFKEDYPEQLVKVIDINE